MRLRLLPAALVACSLLAGCSASQAEPPESWTVELSTAPTLLALSDDQVYAASYGNGVGGSQVYRVDRSLGRLVAQQTVAGQPNGLALAPDGEVWLATLQLPDQPTGTGLQVLDPTTLQTRRTVKVAGVPLSLAFVGGELWVGDGDGVRKVDPRTGAALRTVATAVKAYRLWLVHPDDRGAAVVQRYDVSSLEPDVAVVRADPASGQVRAERELAVTGPLVADESSVVAAQSQGLAAVPAACGAAD